MANWNLAFHWLHQQVWVTFYLFDIGIVSQPEFTLFSLSSLQFLGFHGWICQGTNGRKEWRNGRTTDKGMEWNEGKRLSLGWEAKIHEASDLKILKFQPRGGDGGESRYAVSSMMSHFWIISGCWTVIPSARP